MSKPPELAMVIFGPACDPEPIIPHVPWRQRISEQPGMESFIQTYSCEHPRCLSLPKDTKQTAPVQ